MSHVDFKKWPCRPVEFKGQGPRGGGGGGGGDPPPTWIRPLDPPL